MASNDALVPLPMVCKSIFVGIIKADSVKARTWNLRARLPVIITAKSSLRNKVIIWGAKIKPTILITQEII